MNEMNECVVLNLKTYDNMKMQHNILVDNYEKKEVALDLMESTMKELLGLYLERVALTFKVKECDNKDTLIDPIHPNFLLIYSDYDALLSMGIDEYLIIDKLKELVEKYG